MKKLLNTLFITSEDAYLTLDGENVVVNREKQEIGRFPLHGLSGLILVCGLISGTHGRVCGARH